MIEHLIINASFIIGLSMISQPGYILHWYRNLCENIPFLHKPLITCQLCMSSIYGILYSVIVIHVKLSDWMQVCVYLLALVFVVAILKTITDLLLKIREYMTIRVDGLNLDVQEMISKINHEDDHD